ncbi:30S ribosomal protein s31 mitochondrial [Phtheirospermum japonicum]|uniref:30S ribosomal protein s31 mitochondrial n=1 Tax=Phtheirospermum japonicum TaxID=374723 RepID=A0A830BV26_9LAMI|nr:30S ribosomal protein s31 mitochondrial [Phtheirospermum japonicum]
MSYSSLSSSMASPAVEAPILCGRGDKKTKKGKRFKGSYGNCRPKKEQKVERIKDKIEVPRSTPWPLPFKLI